VPKKTIDPHSGQTPTPILQSIRQGIDKAAFDDIGIRSIRHSSRSRSARPPCSKHVLIITGSSGIGGSRTGGGRTTPNVGIVMDWRRITGIVIVSTGVRRQTTGTRVL
jgi:hypothetical protein